MIKRTALIFLLGLGATLLCAAEPGSGYYAKECKRPGGGYNILIYKDGTAMVESAPEVYEKVMTSYSFFGNDTPSDFVVAILFDAKHTPLPSYKGKTGWIEIWKGYKGNYYLLENGRASKEFKQCSKAE
jgi:hypothetical protein